MTELESLSVAVTVLMVLVPSGIIWIFLLVHESNRQQRSLHELQLELIAAKGELRSEIWAGDRELRSEIWEGDRELRSEIWDGDRELRQEITTHRQELHRRLWDAS